MYHSTTCCFSGYRPEKFDTEETQQAEALAAPLEHAILRAAKAGYSSFFCGMSRGFDLWAADAVLRLRADLPLTLTCCLPYPHHAAAWIPGWYRLHERVLRQADNIICLSQAYDAACFHLRNRFMVDASSRLICWYDGKPGGTAYTIAYAQSRGLFIDNLAPNVQLTL